MKKSLNEMEHIGRLIDKVLKAYGCRPNGELNRIWQLWDDIVGEDIAIHAQPEAFKGTLLLVKVSNSTWMHHLQFLKKDIIHNINEVFGKNVVEEIRFKIGNVG